MLPVRALRGWVAVGASLAVLSHALAAGAFRCSARGGDPWREYRSAHFVVLSDVPGRRAGELVRALERTHALIVQALVGEQAEIPGRVRALVVEDPALFRSLAGSRELRGYYLVSEPLGEPTVVLPSSTLDDGAETVAHELAHRISRFLYPRQPTWFAEGLAEFVETVALPSEPGHPGHWAGLSTEESQRGLRGSAPVPARELLAWRHSRDDPGGRRHFYSWVLYHWLWNARSRQFTSYQGMLARAEDPALAWRTAFPEYDPAGPGALSALDRELGHYLRTGRFLAYEVKLPPGEAPFTEAPVAPADVHLALVAAALPGQGLAAEADARAEVGEALREDPLEPEALFREAGWERRSAAADLVRAAAARPRDWRAALLAGRALEGAPGAEAQLRSAVLLNPDSAYAADALARVLAKGGRRVEALHFANRAVDLAPWCAACVHTLAVVAADLGRCREALLLERRAADLAGEAEAAATEAGLREVELQCGGAAPREAR